MRTRGAILGVVLALAAATVATRSSSAAPKDSPGDPLAAEIERWSRFVRTHSSSDEDWAQVQGITQPVLAEARTALDSGRRLFALQRLSAARALLSASAYVADRPQAERRDEKAFEAERARMGRVLRADLTAPNPSDFEGVHPAAVRALGEASLPQVKIFYDISLEYARNTMPTSGLFYIGEARAQREFAQLCRRLSEPPKRPPPPLRPLGPELDRLEGRLLAAYQPPLSIDRHPDFIGASSTLKEARELDAAGLRYGALLRYLQSVQRTATLLPAAPPDGADAVSARLDGFERQLSRSETDATIGRLFVESARAELAQTAAAAGLERAPAIASEVLPAYFAALEPPQPETPRPPARVTVTLVRWPYT